MTRLKGNEDSEGVVLARVTSGHKYPKDVLREQSSYVESEAERITIEDKRKGLKDSEIYLLGHLGFLYPKVHVNGKPRN